ncbi:MAG: P pilus assembly protein, chaperone PapD [Cyanobacteria bacterium P01_A01_bin.84]
MLNLFKSAASSICFFSITLSSLFVSHDIAYSQVGIAPIIIEKEASRGRVESVINVINTGDKTIRVRIFSQSFIYTQEGKFKILSTNKQDLSPYLQFSPRELSIAPKSTRKIRLLTLLDPNLPDAEYRAVIFAEHLIQNNSQNGGSVGMITRVGTTMYVKKGSQSPSLVVDNSNFNKGIQRLRLLVKNQGNASVRPSVSWTLKQNGKLVREGKTIPATIITRTSRYIPLEDLSKNSSLIPPGKYELNGYLIWRENNEDRSLAFQLPVNISQ